MQSMSSSSPTTELPAWLASLRRTVVPAVRADETISAGDAEVGLTEVARLRGELAVLQARLVTTLAASAGRDTAAALTRGLGLSRREARDALKVAGLVAGLEGAAEALSAGRVREAHLSALAAAAEEDRAELLTLAHGQSVEEFSRTVMAHRIAKEPGWRARQRASRSVRFFLSDDGCIGMRALLPPVEGARLKARLVELMDAKYRADHPERAKTLGAHNVDPVEQRMADALMALVDGEGVGAASGGGGRAAVIVVVDPDACTAEVLGQGPITFDEAADLAADTARADVYAAVRDTNGAILKFGRSRRLASRLQRLAMAVRDRGCTSPGCEVPAPYCEAHHEPPFEDGTGRTDLEFMTMRCPPHHHHRHETGETTSWFFTDSGPPGSGPGGTVRDLDREAA